MESDNSKNLTDDQRVEQFKRRLAAALKRILAEPTNQNGKEPYDEKSHHFSQKNR